MDDLADQLFELDSDQEFNELCLKIFHHQAARNSIYARYLRTLGISPDSVKDPDDIPFLPIEFFKTHRILTGPDDTFEQAFVSSGTTGTAHGHHFVKDRNLYEQSFTRCFEQFYGPPGDYLLIALLPSYLEQGNSSLVYMADRLIRATGHPLSGFYPGDGKKLEKALASTDRQVLLLGVTYALLDLAQKKPATHPGLIVMETGGMKCRRREMVREEVHQVLCDAFGIPSVHSEYGMTELLSQAYSHGRGIFRTPPWM